MTFRLIYVFRNVIDIGVAIVDGAIFCLRSLCSGEIYYYRALAATFLAIVWGRSAFRLNFTETQR